MERISDNLSEGGDFDDVILRNNKVYMVSNVVTNPLSSMLSSKEKRKARRQIEERVPSSRGMDINPFHPKTKKQDALWQTIDHSVVTIAIGSSGTGKTLVSLWYGLHHLSLGHFRTIYYVRSDVGVAHQRGRGALPGSMDEKMAPLVAPLYDNLSIIMRSNGAAEYLMSKKIIQPLLLEDVRGRSLNDAFIIFDEAQNSTVDQTKTVLSRTGERSKIVVTGDTRQIDLDVFNRNSGLLDAYHRLAEIPGIGTLQFSTDDIVRNGIITDILNAYEV
jgi:phosphate starvation-inducible PhoH-like protein